MKSKRNKITLFTANHQFIAFLIIPELSGWRRKVQHEKQMSNYSVCGTYKCFWLSRWLSYLDCWLPPPGLATRCTRQGSAPGRAARSGPGSGSPSSTGTTRPPSARTRSTPWTSWPERPPDRETSWSAMRDERWRTEASLLWDWAKGYGGIWCLCSAETLRYHSKLLYY